MMSYSMEYLFDRFRSAALAVSPPHTAGKGLLAFAGGWPQRHCWLLPQSVSSDIEITGVGETAMMLCQH